MDVAEAFDTVFLSTPSARRATVTSTLRGLGRGKFLSTPSARRATKDGTMTIMASKFLSTPSARRATRRSWASSIPMRDFYPRPLRGGRQDAISRLLT